MTIRLTLTVELICLAVPVVVSATPQTQNPLTLEERVAYQRAIEEVYWRHRIWPEHNRQAKPDLEQVLPLSAIRAKVQDYLGKSRALEVLSQRPIRGEQMQAEMERIARQTKQPEILEELQAALGNDPYVLAECLARPILANRLLRNWYAYDRHYHGDLKRLAEADLRAHGTASQMRSLSGEYREITWIKEEAGTVRSDSEILSAAKNRAVMLGPDEWDARVGELAQVFAVGITRRWTLPSPIDAPLPALDQSPLQLPVGKLSRLQEDAGRFYVTAVLDKGAEQLRVATVEWSKEPFDTWWRAVQDRLQGEMAAPPYEYRQAEVTGCATCVDDTWTPTLAPVISARFLHTAVWTGSEMIVWGGSLAFNTGGRYDPATDTWTPTNTTNAPSRRFEHSAVWTGTEMIIWGGADSDYLNSGGRYDPATDSWTATSLTNAPSKRRLHSAVWTGAKMIVWGGGLNQGDNLNTGGLYDPNTDCWTATDTINPPAARALHTAVWTGREMIVWGGYDNTAFDSGGRYDPVADTWTATSRTNAPINRYYHTAVWTGDEMIVWGGYSPNTSMFLYTGGRYSPTTDRWTATNTTNPPSRRYAHTAVWTDNEMIVWGGVGCVGTDCIFFDSGGRYDPATDTWRATDGSTAPNGRAFHTAIWTGNEMIVWGGYENDVFNGGGRYNPVTDCWIAINTDTNIPSSGRIGHTAVWTGTEMIIWGGSTEPAAHGLNTGWSYDSATDCWTATGTINAPRERSLHTAVWTGSEMIVWGGSVLEGGVPTPVNTGARYDPASGSWTATNMVNAPIGRQFHTAVWTGSKMIVWGATLDTTGGLYDPATDCWAPTTVTNAPSARVWHTAVWTGSKMIVWGGGASIVFNTGGQYDPTNDSWALTSTSNAPSARWLHTAVWTGREMIVWGGSGGGNTGGRYDPATDIWTPTNATNAPGARDFHTAVWTDTEMIIWGGEVGPDFFNTGGRYDPATDSWTATSTTNAPSERVRHTAVWTGSEMIVWGGPAAGTGGRYCAIRPLP